jgi:hypothetical protein
MNLSPRLRILLGLITICLFVVLGATFVSGGRNILGGLMLLAAFYRSYVLVKQIRWVMYAEDEE